MKKIILLMLISSGVWAQQVAKKPKYGINQFMLIERVEDQEKKYNELVKEPVANLERTALNDFQAELAYLWLAKGNVERFQHYHAKKPKYSYRQALYLGYAVEKLLDEKKDYTNAAKISAMLLKEMKGTPAEEGIRFSVLYEVNAAANAKLKHVELAQKMIAQSTADKSSASRTINYFKDMQANYLNRQAMVQLAAGEHQKAFDLLEAAFKGAESNTYMVDTFKEAFEKVKGTSSGFEDYLKALKDSAYQKYYKEVAKIYVETPKKTFRGTMPNVDNPAEVLTSFENKLPIEKIAMKSLNGQSVPLADYKGKILVLDFWTTLCTPCVAAFSGFEKVTSDYNKDKLQLFVVNIFEENATVKAFAAQKPVKLEVLQDQENTAFNIGGTPTKVVFDPMGNIRFYSTGYAGSTDREYYKLKAMVAITAARAAETSAKTK